MQTAQFWKMVELKVADLNGALHQSSNMDLVTRDVPYVRITRPSYQRSLVWGDKKGAAFRSSLARGYPFGVLVLADEGVKEGVDSTLLRHHHFEIIDGQQRSFWLEKIAREFFSAGWFIDDAEDNTQLQSLWTSLLSVICRDESKFHNLEILKAIVMDGHETLTQSRDEDFYKHVCLKLAVPQITDVEKATSAMARSGQLHRFLIDKHDAYVNLKVPALVIGLELKESLPDVFVKLNDSIVLDKFERLAASWSMVTIDMATAPQVSGGSIDVSLAEKLLDYAENRLNDDDLYKDDYRLDVGNMDTSMISLYEYFYSLSRYLCFLHPTTLGSIPEAKNQLALVTAAILFVGDSNRVADLIRHYPKGANGEVDIHTLPLALKLAADTLATKIGEVISWDLGASPTSENPEKRRSVPTSFGLIEAATYMAALIANVFEVTDRRIAHRENGSGPSTASLITGFQNNLWSWYLLDGLNTPFKSSAAYTNSMNRVWKDFERREPSAAMTDEVKIDQLASSLKMYLLNSMDVEVTKTRRSMSNPSLAALFRICYMRAPRNAGEDRDHVIPLKRLESLPNVPINHFGNWMPLSKTDNRSRQDGLWAECIGSANFDRNRNTIKTNLFIEATEVNREVIASTKNYKKFLLNRTNLMLHQTIRNLNHPSMPPDTQKVDQDNWISNFQISEEDAKAFRQEGLRGGSPQGT